MKGPKIENLRDPKWLGKKVIKSYVELCWVKVLHQGQDEFVYINHTGFESLHPYNPQECQEDFDWHEWIEEENPKDPEIDG